MTKGISTYFGEPLSEESKKLVNEVRLKITQPISLNFDNDFNIYRFVFASERVHRKRKDIVEHAAKLLNNHLRLRKALKLDHLPDTPFDENPLFAQRLLPKGDILDATDNSNRLLWYVEYATLNAEALAHSTRTSESFRLQFLQYEHLLRRVNKQEEKTGKLSGVRHIIDLNGFDFNPFTMFLITNGSLAYSSQILHYENYPELVNPVEMVNSLKWIHVAYKIGRAMMPNGFTDRFRLYDGNFLPILQKEIEIEDIPVTLGGQNEKIRCVPAKKLTSDHYFKPKDLELLESLETVSVCPRTTRQFHIDIKESGKKLQWYYTTDGTIYFGVFYQPSEQVSERNCKINGTKQDSEVDCDELEMIYPWFKLSAKLVHEMDYVECLRPGRYWMIFCNKDSWIHKRTINITIQLVDTKEPENTKRCHTDGTFSSSTPFVIDFL